MFEMPVKFNSILPCQEAFLVDAPTPNTSPHRWIQAKQGLCCVFVQLHWIETVAKLILET